MSHLIDLFPDSAEAGEVCGRPDSRRGLVPGARDGRGGTLALVDPVLQSDPGDAGGAGGILGGECSCFHTDI